MTDSSVFGVACALTFAVRSETVERTNFLVAPLPLKALHANTLASLGVAVRIVRAFARLRAVGAVSTIRTGRFTLIASETDTTALSCDRIALVFVVARTFFGATVAVKSVFAAPLAENPRVTREALTTSVELVAMSSILAIAAERAVRAVSSLLTFI